MTLAVYRESTLVGSLDMHESEPFFGFTYDRDYLAEGGAAALSLSLPLDERRYSGAQTLPYFEGLLPEGNARHVIARRLGVSAHSPAKLLRALGRDCAGDVMVVDKDDPLNISAAVEYLPLEKGVRFIMDNPTQELSRLQETYRLSLAGGQEKIALYHDNCAPMESGWYIPLSGSPSTHILKPQVSDKYPHLALNEFLCMRAAAFLGMPVAGVSLLFPEQPLLVVKRYDRAVLSDCHAGGLAMVKRTHQEDFCQALGYSSEEKYENDGGPGAKDIRNLIALHSGDTLVDVKTFITLFAFNYLIGNCDAHAKNFSLLHESSLSDGTPIVRLAPAYDVLSTTIYSGDFGAKLSRSMGMCVGEHFNIDKVTQADFLDLASRLKVSEKAFSQVMCSVSQGLNAALLSAAGEAVEVGFAEAGRLAQRIILDSQKRKALFN